MCALTALHRDSPQEKAVSLAAAVRISLVTSKCIRRVPSNLKQDAEEMELMATYSLVIKGVPETCGDDAVAEFAPP